MIASLTKTALSVLGIAVVGLSLTAVTPAHARSGLGAARPTSQFMMKNGSQFHANTRQRGLCLDPSEHRKTFR